jgi:predicted AAA+ superfamily ATPase
MTYIHRQIEDNIQAALARGKSILLLGPRQTGKTTLLRNKFPKAIKYSLVRTDIRQRYERDPSS